jgi:hypothetical protein
MSHNPYRVIVVVDRAFGEQLESIPRGVAVWIVDSPANRPVVEKLRREYPEPNYLKGIGLFTSPESFSAELSFLDELYMVDLHHGEYSADPPYSVLEVIGVGLTEPIQTALEQIEFYVIHDTNTGLRAVRSLQPASTSNQG